MDVAVRNTRFQLHPYHHRRERARSRLPRTGLFRAPDMPTVVRPVASHDNRARRRADCPAVVTDTHRDDECLALVSGAPVDLILVRRREGHCGGDPNDLSCVIDVRCCDGTISPSGSRCILPVVPLGWKRLYTWPLGVNAQSPVVSVPPTVWPIEIGRSAHRSSIWAVTGASPGALNWSVSGPTAPFMPPALGSRTLRFLRRRSPPTLPPRSRRSRSLPLR